MPIADLDFTGKIDRRFPRNKLRLNGSFNDVWLRENLLSRDGRLERVRGTQRFHAGLSFDSIDNEVANGNFEDWGSGISVAPVGWTLVGAGALASRNEDSKIDTYSAKLTRVGANAIFRQNIHGGKGITYWQGKTVTAVAWVKCSTANIARIQIGESAGSESSSFHTGDGTRQLLKVTKTISGAATFVRIDMQIITSDGTALFDGAIIAEGSNNPYTANLTDISTWIGRYYTIETGQVSPKTFAYTIDGKLWVYDEQGIATLIKEGLNTNAYPNSWMFKTALQTKMYFVDGLNLYEYDGNNDNKFTKVDITDIDGNPIKPIDLIEHKDRLCLISKTDLFISVNLKPSVFDSATDSFQGIVGSGKGQNLSIRKIEDFLFIMNTEGIFQLRGDTISAQAVTFSIDLVEERFIISSRSASKVETAIVFLAAQDKNIELWSFNGTSSKLLSYVEKLTDYINTKRIHLDKATSTYEDNYYKISVVEKGQVFNNLEFWFDALEDKIEIIRNRNVSAYMTTDPTREENFSLVGKSTEGKVLWADRGYNFDEVAIPIYLVTKHITIKKFHNLRFLAFYPEFEPVGNRNVRFRYLIDGRLSIPSGLEAADEPEFYGNLRGENKGAGFVQFPNQAQFSSRIRPKIKQSRGENIGFEIYDNNKGYNFKMTNFGIEYIDKGRKKGKGISK